MDKFLKSYFPSTQDFKKERLPGDGGHRNYTRIKSGKQSFILMSCGKKDISLKSFIEVQKRLEPLVCVPKVFHMDFDIGLLLLEDLGDQSLEQLFFQKGIDLSLSFYYQSLRQLICFQNKIKPFKSDPVFDTAFFLEENNRAIHHLQTYINHHHKKGIDLFNEKSPMSFKKDMNKVLSNFKKEDYVYCHRDYHSRNLIVKKNKTYLIDFQDAGLGPWYYDLTSLLYDSYVSLNFLNKRGFSIFYFENLPPSLKKKAISLSHIELMAKLQFLQRGFKACGCFASFKNLNQKDSHLKYIRPTISLLKKTALELDYMGIYEYTKEMESALEELHGFNENWNN